MCFFTVFLLLCHSLQGELREPLQKNDDTSLKTTPFSEKEGIPNMFVDGVNVITGSYSVGVVDAEVAAPSAFSVSRHYAPLVSAEHVIAK